MIKIVRGLLYIVAIGIALAGLTSLFNPDFVTESFHVVPSGLAGKAELRGIYGGGFFSFGVTTLLGLRLKRFGPGLLLSMALFMICAAVARSISLVLDGEISFTLPAMISEYILAAMYWFASRKAN